MRHLFNKRFRLKYFYILFNFSRMTVYWQGRKLIEMEPGLFDMSGTFLGEIGCTECRGYFGNLQNHDKELHDEVSRRFAEGKNIMMMGAHSNVNPKAVDELFEQRYRLQVILDVIHDKCGDRAEIPRAYIMYSSIGILLSGLIVEY